MSIYRRIKLPFSRGPVGFLVLILVTGFGQTGCTRGDVAAAVSTVAAQLEATLEPWGATTVAGAQSAYSTAKAPITPTAISSVSETGNLALQIDDPLTITASPRALLATSTAIPVDTATATPSATATPEPTATSTATYTSTPTPTQTPSPTPYPAQVEVPGGTMILIPGGNFQMGADAGTLAEECNKFRDGCQPDWFVASEPVHSVLLERYYIDEHEVTTAAFGDFLNENGVPCGGLPCFKPEESQIALQDNIYVMPEGSGSEPVTGVTWYGAAAFCDWRDARLPTEAEWERAAAWDAESSIARRYPWGDEFDGKVLNFCDSSCAEQQANPDFDDGYPDLAPVATYENGRSPSGLFDMAGNVWEWVADWYDPLYYAESAASNPTGPGAGEEKVVRGGSWFDTGNFAASAIRFPSSPDNADRTIGFRCATSLP